MPLPRARIAKEIARAREKHGLTEKQAEFAIRYATDPETAGNKTASGLAVYNTTVHEHARQLAWDALRKPHVRTYLQELLERVDFGVEVRSTLLSDIATGKTRTRSTQTQRDGSGNVTAVSETETEAPLGVRLKAIDLANKLEGRYTQADATVRVAEREYNVLRSKLLRDAGLGGKGNAKEPAEEPTGEGGGPPAGG